MAIKARIAKIEKEISKKQESVDFRAPLIELPPERKAAWPKWLPYPIMGGLAYDSVQKNHK